MLHTERITSQTTVAGISTGASEEQMWENVLLFLGFEAYQHCKWNIGCTKTCNVVFQEAHRNECIQMLWHSSYSWSLCCRLVPETSGPKWMVKKEVVTLKSNRLLSLWKERPCWCSPQLCGLEGLPAINLAICPCPSEGPGGPCVLTSGNTSTFANI